MESVLAVSLYILTVICLMWLESGDPGKGKESLPEDDVCLVGVCRTKVME